MNYPAAGSVTPGPTRKSIFDTWLARGLSVLVLVAAFVLMNSKPGAADAFDDSSPSWEPLLWGGMFVHPDAGPPASPLASSRQKSPGKPEDRSAATAQTTRAQESAPALEQGSAASRHPEDLFRNHLWPAFSMNPDPPALADRRGLNGSYCSVPYRTLSLRNIPPLYTSPQLPGEGIWEWKGMPAGENRMPVVYKTTYRPSEEFPNAIVHMLLFDLKQVSMRLYIGSSEPGASQAVSRVESENLPSLLAITNGLWKLRHSGGGGVIFRGNVLKELATGLATIVVYHDGAVDIVEWDDSIPASEISDARQLKHLIVKDGRVVTSIVKHGQESDSEIGMGSLLDESQPTLGTYWGFPQGQPILNHTSGPYWFLATRSAFGIRQDGNLVFAVGHHIGTKDLAKALVLAGCVRGIHGDANPGNALGNLYYTDQGGKIVNVDPLSPKQGNHTLQRYLNSTYTSDFYAFFKKEAGEKPNENAAAPLLRTLF